MAEIDGNVFLVGAAFSFITFLIACQAFLTTTASFFDVVFAVRCTVVLAADIPVVAYCVGLILARGGKVTRTFFIGMLQVFILSLRICSTGTGFWGALSCSTLASGMIFLAKVGDGTDDRFHVVKSVMLWYWPSATQTVGSDFASDMCVWLVFVLATILLPFDPTVPTPGSLHDFVSGLYSSPPAQQAAAPPADLPQL